MTLEPEFITRLAAALCCGNESHWRIKQGPQPAGCAPPTDAAGTVRKTTRKRLALP